MKPAKIFLSYAREDKEKVENLYKQLLDYGFDPWMDTKRILPGENWERCIQKALQESDFFLACLSKNSVDKRGILQKEIKEALEIKKKMLDNDIQTSTRFAASSIKLKRFFEKFATDFFHFC